MDKKKNLMSEWSMMTLRMLLKNLITIGIQPSETVAVDTSEDKLKEALDLGVGEVYQLDGKNC